MTISAVVDADGTFGDKATVWFSGSLQDCKAYAKRTRNVQVLAGCTKPVGAKILVGVLRTMVQSGMWQVR